MGPVQGAIVWDRLDALIERAAGVANLRWHRLHLYAAWRWRELDRPIPEDIRALERQSAALRLAVPSLLARVREAYDGPILLLKGADVAARYPRPDLRPSSDLDLLVPDAEEVHRMLLESGFKQWDGDHMSTEHHHLPLLVWPNMPGGVEIHRAPNWPTWLTPPRTSELMSVATDESVVGHGVRTLPAAHHALVLTAHLWRDDPAGRLGQLVDVHLMSGESSLDAINDLAQAWGIEKLWRVTNDIALQVLGRTGNGRLGARVVARGLGSLHERSVLESKVFELGAPFYGLTPSLAALAAVRHAVSLLRPDPTETWKDKARTLRRSLSPISVATNRELVERRRELGDSETE